MSTVKIQVVVFWAMMSCTDVDWYHHFRGPCYLYLQDEIHGAWKWT